VASQLRPRPEVALLDSEDERTTVAVVVADGVDEETIQVLRRAQRDSCRSVLVIAQIDDTGLAAAVEAGVAGLVRRSEATPERLAKAVCAAAVMRCVNASGGLGCRPGRRTSPSAAAAGR
jgi:DNA-binding NarL/FixJ family response regulator